MNLSEIREVKKDLEGYMDEFKPLIGDQKGCTGASNISVA